MHEGNERDLVRESLRRPGTWRGERTVDFWGLLPGRTGQQLAGSW